MNNKDSIVAGIVLYNPDIKRLKQNLEAVISQVKNVILFDNGSNNVVKIEEFLSSSNYSNVKLLKSKENTGIAHALNEIAKKALASNDEWLLTLDQDTVLKSNLVTTYVKYLTLPNVGQLCCDFIDRNTGRREYDHFDSKKYGEIDKWITSGSLVNLEALKKVGGFDEDLFIDYVDFDLCFVLRKFGYKNYIINVIGMIHEIGERREYNLGFKTLDIMNHSAFRQFYITRNEIVVSKRYPKEKLPNMYRIQLNTLIKIIMFENNKCAKSKAVINGILKSYKYKVLRNRFL